HTRFSRDWSSDVCSSDLKVIGCHFWMADNSTEGTGALLEITTDSVLVERSVFRAPPGGTGRSFAIRTGGSSALVVEIRANLFYKIGRASCRERVLLCGVG